MKMPVTIRPMLATLIDKPFDNAAWSFEMKLDGYRIMAYIEKGVVKLLSRNLKDYSARFYPITAYLKKWNINAVIDGEVVCLNNKGVSVFNDLQNWKTENDGPLYYYAFDLLWYKGKNIMQQPLFERRNLLRSILPSSDTVIFSDEVVGKGKSLFELIKKHGLEGIMAKKRDSIYRPGERSRDWLKVKTAQREEFIICGYTRNEASGKLFSSLVIGQYSDKDLQLSGQLGTGYSDQDQRDILRRLKPLIRKTCPFKDVPDLKKDGRWRRLKPELIVWCKPALVCEVQFLERTPGGELRHQSFVGLRDDKDPLAIQVK